MLLAYLAEALIVAFRFEIIGGVEEVQARERVTDSPKDVDEAMNAQPSYQKARVLNTPEVILSCVVGLFAVRSHKAGPK